MLCFPPKEEEHVFWLYHPGQCRALGVPALFIQRNTPMWESLSMARHGNTPSLSETKQPSQTPLSHP